MEWKRGKKVPFSQMVQYDAWEETGWARHQEFEMAE